MKTNITNVSNRLTLGRGATLVSNKDSVIDILRNSMSTDSYSSIRSKTSVSDELKSFGFCSGGFWNLSTSKLLISGRTAFANPNDINIRLQNGDALETASSRSLNLSLIEEISDLVIFQINDNITGVTNIPFSVRDGNALEVILNYFFNKNPYSYPYIASYDVNANTLTITNKNEDSTIFTIGVGDYNEKNELAYNESSEDEEGLANFLTFDGRFALNNEEITIGTAPEEDTLINRYEFRDSEKCVGYVAEEYTNNGELITTIAVKNPNNNGSSYIKLHVDSEGNAWTETLTPAAGDNSNKIATTRFVQEFLSSAVIYKGTFDASAGNYNALSNSKVGYMYYVNGNGTINGIEWKVGDYLLVNADGATDVTKIDNTESEDIVRLNATQTLTNKTLTSPALTGVPTAPTAAVGTRTTQIASTAFVYDAISSQQPTIDQTPTENSSNLVTSGGVYSALSLKADTLSVPSIIDGIRNTWGYLTLEDLPIASKSQAGIVIAGEGINITNAGLISVDFSGIVKPTDKATSSTLGLVKPDNTTILIDNNGTLSANLTGLSFVDFTSEETISGTKTFSGGLRRTSSLDYNTFDSEVITRQWLRNYQAPVDVIDVTSGTISLETNKIYKVSINGNTTFTLVEPTNKTQYNQIKVMLQVTGTPTIVWGTNYFYQAEAPDISEAGNYSIYYDYDLNMNKWVCGSLFIDTLGN